MTVLLAEATDRVAQVLYEQQTGMVWEQLDRSWQVTHRNQANVAITEYHQWLQEQVGTDAFRDALHEAVADADDYTCHNIMALGLELLRKGGGEE